MTNTRPGGLVQIRGEIKDGVRAAGGDITIKAKMGDDLFAAGGAIRIIGGKIRISGIIDGNVECVR